MRSQTSKTGWWLECLKNKIKEPTLPQDKKWGNPKSVKICLECHFDMVCDLRSKDRSSIWHLQVLRLLFCELLHNSKWCFENHSRFQSTTSGFRQLLVVAAMRSLGCLSSLQSRSAAALFYRAAVCSEATYADVQPLLIA